MVDIEGCYAAYLDIHTEALDLYKGKHIAFGLRYGIDAGREDEVLDFLCESLDDLIENGDAA